MPSKSSGPAQAAPSLLALPPEVLLHILAAVPQADRWARGSGEGCGHDRRSGPAGGCRQRLPPLTLPLPLPPPASTCIAAASTCRLSSVALTCKQLHGLCSAPPLLSSVDVRIHGARVLPRMQTLLHFLVKRGEHVRSLRLDVVYFERGSDSNEAAVWLAACLAACAARQAQPGGGLRQLVLEQDKPLAAG